MKTAILLIGKQYSVFFIRREFSVKNNVAIGVQSFEKLRQRKCFYIDKTDFIRELWESDDDVTLITRPRRFGKTLNMTMLEAFFSLDYADRGDLFRVFPSGKMRNTGKCRGHILLFFYHLPI